MPPGSVAGLTVSAANVVTLYARVAEVPPLSVARTVKLLGPAVVGVPEMTPLDALSVRPAGRVPTLML